MGSCLCCGPCEGKKAETTQIAPDGNKYGPTIRCYYDIKDDNEIQIINDRDGFYINEEIKSKIKMFDGKRITELIMKKKFNRFGSNYIDFIIIGQLSDMSFMFNNCSSLKSISFISTENIKINNMKAMFNECNNLEYVELNNLDTSNVIDMGWLFNHCYKLKYIQGINRINTSKVINMIAMFQGCSELEYLDLANFNTVKVNDMGFMFNLCHKLKEIKGINRFITTNVSNMERMFQECKKISFLDLSNFDTSNVIDFEFMFNECHELKEIKGINQFKTSKAKNMKAMFQECNNLEYLNLSGFNTDNVTDMGWMFNQCHKIKHIEGINKFNTSQVNNMNSMFQKCTELKYLDLTNFNTAKVTDMGYMFNICTKLKKIKGINNFNTSNLKITEYMFQACTKLENLDLYKKKFQTQLNNYSNATLITQETIPPTEKQLIAITFLSTDQKIRSAIPCYNTDYFSSIEQKIYHKYPELVNKHINFIANGKIINRLYTLEQNDIQDNDQILICYLD